MLILKVDLLQKQNCKEFSIASSTYYEWKKKFDLGGEEELKRRKPVFKNHPRKIPQEVIERVIELIIVYQLGSIRITWYLERYHDIKISESGVKRILKRRNKSFI